MLIIHESPLLRQLMAGYAQAEFSDIVLEEASDAAAGLTRLAEKKYDVVLAGVEGREHKGLALFSGIRDTTLNADTPVVGVTTALPDEEKRALKNAGLDHLLSAPYTGRDFARKVEAACGPRRSRSRPRFGAFGREARVEIEGGRISAGVVNISLSGVLAEIEDQDDFDFLLPCNIDLVFGPPDKERRAEGIRAAASRLRVMRWDDEGAPLVVRAAWRFLDTPPAAAGLLEAVLAEIAPPEEGT